MEEESLDGQLRMMPEHWQWSSSYSVAIDTLAEYCYHYREKSQRGLPCATHPCLSSLELPCSIVKASEVLGQAVEKMVAYDSHLCFQWQVPAEEACHFLDLVSLVAEVGLGTAAPSSAGLVVRLANCPLAYSCLAEREP